ncbi:hypothetical protein OXX69_008420 [Metschnikowia pulcherrima]
MRANTFCVACIVLPLVLARNASETFNSIGSHLNNASILRGSERRFKSLESDTRLSSFVSRLKSYVNETSFDTDKFKLDVSQLRKELAEIDISMQIEEIMDHYSNDGTFVATKDWKQNEKTADELRFAKYMLRAMSDSVQDLHFSDGENSLGHHLLRCLTQLNIRLLLLRDCQGIPDPSIPGYGEMVFIQGQYLKVWKDTYTKLAYVPPGLNHKLMKYFVQAENTLKVLARLSQRRRGSNKVQALDSDRLILD